MWNKTKATAKKLIKNTILYGSAILVAATLLDLALYTASYKAIMAVQLPHSCQMATTTAQVATTTQAIVAPAQKLGKPVVLEVSAYNSVPEQTDGNPCIAADNTDICKRHAAGECIVAANRYAKGTRLHIDKVGDCTVADRTASKHANRIDLFMDKDVDRAINFGVQRLAVSVIE